MSGHFHPYNKTKLDKWKINNFSWTYERTECVACKDVSSSTRIEPMPPTVEVWSPNHWTTREFPLITFFVPGRGALC